MKIKSLPHLPQSLAKLYDTLLTKDYKLLQVSSVDRLGTQLMDLSLTVLQNEEKVKVVILDPMTMAAFIHRAEEIGLIAKTRVPGRIHLEWSSNIYPSQKILALDKVFPKLNQSISGKSLFEIIATSHLSEILPKSKSLTYLNLDNQIIEKIEAAYSLYNPLIDYSSIEQLIHGEDLDLDTLRLEMKRVKSQLKLVSKVLRSVERTFQDTHTLRRMNHSSTNSLILELYKVYQDLDNVLNGLTQVEKVPMKKPLNAAMLTEYLHDQVISWHHRSQMLLSAELLNWLSVIKELPSDVRNALWILAKYKIQQPWQDVLMRQKARQELHQVEYHSNRMKFDDCQHLLRVLVGNIEERIEIVNEVSLLNQEESTLTLIPEHLSEQIVNPLRYEVISTLDDLPVLKSLHTGVRLSDSQLLSNAKTTSQLLATRIPKLQIYLNKSKIIISAVSCRDFEISNYLLGADFYKVNNRSVLENLKECLVDVNRKVYFLTLGSLVAIDDLSDWVYQIQLLEFLEATGITVIDIPIQIATNSENHFPKSIHSILIDYVEG